MLICAMDSLFVLENPNCTKPTQIILVFKKQSPWASENGDSNKNISTNCKFLRVRNYMNIESSTNILNCYTYETSK